jgi:TctA family transporter
MFTFIALAVSGKERSGIMTVINEMLHGVSITPMSETFTAIMIAMAIASILAYVIMIKSGQIMCRMIEYMDVSKLNIAVLILMIVLTIAFTGYWGLVLLLACTLLGLVPVVFDANRMHMTGCLIVPVLLFKLGFM